MPLNLNCSPYEYEEYNSCAFIELDYEFIGKYPRKKYDWFPVRHATFGLGIYQSHKLKMIFVKETKDLLGLKLHIWPWAIMQHKYTNKQLNCLYNDLQPLVEEYRQKKQLEIVTARSKRVVMVGNHYFKKKKLNWGISEATDYLDEDVNEVPMTTDYPDDEQ